MAATPIPVPRRYIALGKRKMDWLTAIANTGSPTRAEINAGTDLSPGIGTVNGFTLVNDQVDVTPIGSSFLTMLSTTLDPTSETCELIFYADIGGNDVRAVLAPGEAGFILLLPEGDVSGRLCEVWPVQVNAMYIEPGLGNISGGTPGQIHVQFTITAQPEQNVIIP
jgi:hypothetical protein